jgi:aromatic-L-amino-acid decarboxylase
MIEQDVNDGLLPFWFGACLGTTSTGSVEPIAEITKISKKHGVFVTVDAAYAGSSLICNEYKYLSE